MPESYYPTQPPDIVTITVQPNVRATAVCLFIALAVAVILAVINLR